MRFSRKLAGLALGLVSLGLAGCDGSTTAVSPARTAPAGLARVVVPAQGTAATLDGGSWNIERFVDAYLDGRIRTALVKAAEDADEAPGTTDPDEERAVVSLLRARLAEDAARTSTTRASTARSA